MSQRAASVVKLHGEGRYQRLLGGAPETAGMKSGWVRLEPGESVGEHSTESREEAILVLEGEVEVVIDGRPAFRAAAEHLIYMPAHTRHDMKNVGSGALRYVYVVAPVALDR